MSKHLTTNAAEIAILQKNLKDLQGQLANAHKRILDLTKDKTVAAEELAKERKLLLELEAQYSAKLYDTEDKIEKQIEEWPDVLDSKPQTFKRPPQPGYSVKKGEKWVSIKDGKMEFDDIEIKD